MTPAPSPEANQTPPPPDGSNARLYHRLHNPPGSTPDTPNALGPNLDQSVEPTVPVTVVNSRVAMDGLAIAASAAQRDAPASRDLEIRRAIVNKTEMPDGLLSLSRREQRKAIKISRKRSKALDKGYLATDIAENFRLPDDPTERAVAIAEIGKRKDRKSARKGARRADKLSVRSDEKIDKLLKGRLRTADEPRPIAPPIARPLTPLIERPLIANDHDKWGHAQHDFFAARNSALRRFGINPYASDAPDVLAKLSGRMRAQGSRLSQQDLDEAYTQLLQEEVGYQLFKVYKDTPGLFARHPEVQEELEELLKKSREDLENNKIPPVVRTRQLLKGYAAIGSQALEPSTPTASPSVAHSTASAQNMPAPRPSGPTQTPVRAPHAPYIPRPTPLPERKPRRIVTLEDLFGTEVAEAEERAADVLRFVSKIEPKQRKESFAEIEDMRAQTLEYLGLPFTKTETATLTRQIMDRLEASTGPLDKAAFDRAAGEVLLETLGQQILSEYQTTIDPEERNELFKKHPLVNAAIMRAVTKPAGHSTEDVIKVGASAYREATQNTSD